MLCLSKSDFLMFFFSYSQMPIAIIAGGGHFSLIQCELVCAFRLYLVDVEGKTLNNAAINECLRFSGGNIFSFGLGAGYLWKFLLSSQSPYCLNILAMVGRNRLFYRDAAFRCYKRWYQDVARRYPLVCSVRML